MINMNQHFQQRKENYSRLDARLLRTASMQQFSFINSSNRLWQFLSRHAAHPPFSALLLEMHFSFTGGDLLSGVCLTSARRYRTLGLKNHEVETSGLLDASVSMRCHSFGLHIIGDPRLPSRLFM
jgi:hypothetical protein